MKEKDWAFAMLFLHMAENGLNDTLQDVRIGAAGRQWLKEHHCPYAASAVAAEIYPLQVWMFKVPYAH